MDTVQQEIIDFTKASDFEHALDIIFRDYVRYKLFYLKSENNRFELKWNMTFDEFEKKSPQMEDGMSYDTEQEYYQWEAIVTELDYFKNKFHQWT